MINTADYIDYCKSKAGHICRGSCDPEQFNLQVELQYKRDMSNGCRDSKKIECKAFGGLFFQVEKIDHYKTFASVGQLISVRMLCQKLLQKIYTSTKWIQL